MRQRELIDGVAVLDQEGKTLAKSKVITFSVPPVLRVRYLFSDIGLVKMCHADKDLVCFIFLSLSVLLLRACP